MSKEMIISVNGREKKIAILDNGKVTEFYIERGEENSGIAGNIYKGRVQRVLPGMQSAFVSIGLERDAFLYVSDFFDEEEEIERIVMEKSKKSTPEEAKREANEQIDRARIEREKQMEAVQEIAEPIADTLPDDEPDTSEDVRAEAPVGDLESGRRDRGRGRKGGRDRQTGRAEAASPERAESIDEEPQASPLFEMEDSGFERVIDDEDTGELFKDAYRQEAIVDKVRAVEFDMETTPVAEVGSLIGSVTDAPSGFERIADEDDAQADAEKKPAKGRRGKAGKTDDAAAEAKPARKTKAAGTKTAKPRKGSKAAKAEESETLEDGEAAVRDTGETAEMTVRRGGRGRRRGGRGRRPEASETTDGDGEISADETTGEPMEAVAKTDNDEGDAGEAVETVQPAEESPAAEKAEKSEIDGNRAPSEPREPRGRRDSRDSRGGRGGADRKESRSRDDRPRDDRPREDRPPREERPRSGQQENGKRFERGDRRDRPAQPTISDLLREGQEILVQIAKEPIARKGARITSHIALPGRFLVYMPTIEHLGVSHR